MMLEIYRYYQPSFKIGHYENTLQCPSSGWLLVSGEMKSDFFSVLLEVCTQLFPEMTYLHLVIVGLVSQDGSLIMKQDGSLFMKHIIWMTC